MITSHKEHNRAKDKKSEDGCTDCARCFRCHGYLLNDGLFAVPLKDCRYHANQGIHHVQTADPLILNSVMPNY